MESKSHRHNIGDVAAVIVIPAIMIGVFIYHYRKDASVAKYRTETYGKIIDFDRNKDLGYSLEYVYYVDGIKYRGSVGTRFFKCANGKKGCVGEEVKVYYSSKEPKYSQVDLGDYDKYKTTVYLKE